MASSKFLSYAGLQELINNKLGIKLGGELSTSGANIILQSKKANLASIQIPLAGTTAKDGTTKLPGLFTNAEKEKLAGIAAGGEVNQNAFSNVKITNNDGTTTALNIAADTKTDTINLTAGTNIKITGDASKDTITIANTYTYNHPDFAVINLSDGNATPAFGATFNALGTLTSNAEGHLTAATFKTVTIPSLPKPSVTVKTATTPTTNTVAVLSTLSASSGGTGISHTFNSVNVPTKKYVDDKIANVVASSQAIVLKGSVASLGTSVTLSKGDAFVCDASNTTIGGQTLEIGDVIIWNGADATTYATSLTDWIYLQKNVDFATDSTPGLIKIGYSQNGKNYPVQLSDGKAYVNVPWSNTQYTADKGIKLSGTVFMHTNTATGTHKKTTSASVSGNGGTFTVAQYLYDEQGHITSSYDKTITVNHGYSLPAATSDVLGGIKIGYTATGKNYPVQLDDNNKAFVNVPWTDGKGVTSVTITQGTGITVSNSGKAITETGTRTISLNAATAETIGGIRVSTANVSGATIDANRFGVKTTTDNIAYVEVLEITTAEINALF